MKQKIVILSFLIALTGSAFSQGMLTSPNRYDGGNNYLDNSNALKTAKTIQSELLEDNILRKTVMPETINIYNPYSQDVIVNISYEQDKSPATYTVNPGQYITLPKNNNGTYLIRTDGHTCWDYINKGSNYDITWNAELGAFCLLKPSNYLQVKE